MAQWNSNSETGILRKNKPKENHDDLLVFGYACKLFRDDEKALYIDQGKHLIPWLGDENLKIDRYDCRGALSDLKPYEGSREGFDAMRWLGLSDAERRLEQFCDEERYYSLKINEEEEEMYKEEELKRQQTNAFQYNYDVPDNPENRKDDTPTVAEAPEEEKEYIPPPSLDVPVDIEIPKTVKENARIEKTALFVHKQGPQMEILIKAKQGNNPQFGFLNQGDPLYKFYRHVLNAIKSGRYISSQADEGSKAEVDSAGDHYLHPSLTSTNSNQHSDIPPTPIPAIPYKPSANCAYSQLVNRIQGGQHAEAPAGAPGTPLGTATQMTYEQQQQYYQYYYAAQYYEYYKQMAQYQANAEGNSNKAQIMPPQEFALDPNMQAYIQQMVYAQYVQQQQQQQQQQQSANNPYAQIVSNVNKDVANPYATLMSDMQQQHDADIAKQPVLYQDEFKREDRQQLKREDIKNSNPNSRTGTPPIKNEADAKSTLLSLAVYGSDSEEEEELPEIKTPTGDVQIVIDKMASYVAKNGLEFQSIVKARADPRFEFLNDSHEFNGYYKRKLEEFMGLEAPKLEANSKAESPTKSKEKKVIAPVSFSIKKPKDEAPKEIKSALPVEESDDEDEGTAPAGEATPPAAAKETEPKQNDEPKRNGILDADDPILEMIDLTEDVEEKKDAKRAEERIRDKLAAAAREKLSSATRDKALQLERKKKALAFLKMKSAEGVTKTTETSVDRKNVRRKSIDQAAKEEPAEKKRKSKGEDDDSSSDQDLSKYCLIESDEESRKRKKSKKKKSHKRKHSKSKHESKSRKKSKRKRSESISSLSSRSSNN